MFIWLKHVWTSIISYVQLNIDWQRHKEESITDIKRCKDRCKGQKERENTTSSMERRDRQGEHVREGLVGNVVFGFAEMGVTFLYT